MTPSRLVGSFIFALPTCAHRKHSDLLLPRCFHLLGSAAAMLALVLLGSAGQGRAPLMVMQCMEEPLLIRFACEGMYAIAIPLDLHTGRPACLLAAILPISGAWEVRQGQC